MATKTIKLYVIIDFDGIATFYFNAIDQNEYDADGFVDFLADKPIFSGSGNKSLILSADTKYEWTLCNLQELGSYNTNPSEPLELNCIKFQAVDDIDPKTFWSGIFEITSNITVNGNEMILNPAGGTPGQNLTLTTIKKIEPQKVNLLYSIKFNFVSNGETKVGNIDPIIDNRTDPEG